MKKELSAEEQIERLEAATNKCESITDELIESCKSKGFTLKELQLLPSIVKGKIERELVEKMYETTLL